MRHSVQIGSEIPERAAVAAALKLRFRACAAAVPVYMATHIIIPIWKGQMKTTVEISDTLLREVRQVAAREGVTLRNLVERGLYRVLAETKDSAPFKLRRASFKGKGLQADMRGASWDRLRALAYEGRGA